MRHGPHAFCEAESKQHEVLVCISLAIWRKTEQRKSFGVDAPRGNTRSHPEHDG